MNLVSGIRKEYDRPKLEENIAKQVLLASEAYHQPDFDGLFELVRMQHPESDLELVFHKKVIEVLHRYYESKLSSDLVQDRDRDAIKTKIVNLENLKNIYRMPYD